MDTACRAGRVLAALQEPQSKDTVLAEPFHPMPSWWSNQFESRLLGLGSAAKNAQEFVISGRPGSACVVGFQADGELTAVCVLDANAEVQQLRTRIQITSPGPLESPAMGRGLAKP